MPADTKTPEPKAAEPTSAPMGWPSARRLIVAAVLLIGVAIASVWAFNEFSDPPQIKATPRPVTIADEVEEGGLPEVTLSKRSDRSGHLHVKAHNQNGKTLQKVKLWIKTAKWDRIYEAKVSIEHGATGTFSVYIGESRIEVEKFKVLYQREYRPPN
jgi:hypothetical protein